MIGIENRPTSETPVVTGRMISRSEATVEALRCLGCFDAPCSQACPVHIDIPGFITRLAQGNLAGSYQLLVTPNPFAATCGLVCPTADLCEGACVLPQMGQSPIRIGPLQYFVAANAYAAETPASKELSERVAVVGAGPSGLSCATALRRYGYRVSVFESASGLGGLMQQVIPPHRLPHQVVREDLKRLESLGIELHLGEPVDAAAAKKLLAGYDAIYLAIGANRPRALSVPGADLKGVALAMDYLREARVSDAGTSDPASSGRTVIVLGGGNVALDAATTAMRRGAERVIVLYRRTLEEMPGWRSEYMEATGLGVEFRWLTTVSAVLGQERRVSGVEVQPMRLEGVGPDGRRGVSTDEGGRRYSIPCDVVLVALGQGLDKSVAESFGVDVTPDGMIAVREGGTQTSVDKVFAGGDAAMGDGTIVHAVAQGMAAGEEIHAWVGAMRRAQ